MNKYWLYIAFSLVAIFRNSYEVQQPDPQLFSLFSLLFFTFLFGNSVLCLLREDD